eukprot:762961-Hanusia_phi.AAC.4
MFLNTVLRQSQLPLQELGKLQRTESGNKRASIKNKSLGKELGQGPGGQKKAWASLKLGKAPGPGGPGLAQKNLAASERFFPPVELARLPHEASCQAGHSVVPGLTHGLALSRARTDSESGTQSCQD